MYPPVQGFEVCMPTGSVNRVVFVWPACVSFRESCTCWCVVNFSFMAVSQLSVFMCLMWGLASCIVLYCFHSGAAYVLCEFVMNETDHRLL